MTIFVWAALSKRRLHNKNRKVFFSILNAVISLSLRMAVRVLGSCEGGKLSGLKCALLGGLVAYRVFNMVTVTGFSEVSIMHFAILAHMLLFVSSSCSVLLQLRTELIGRICRERSLAKDSKVTVTHEFSCTRCLNVIIPYGTAAHIDFLCVTCPVVYRPPNLNRTSS